MRQEGAQRESPAAPMVVTMITASGSAGLIRGQLKHQRMNGFRPVLVSSGGPEVRALAEREGVALYEIRMVRSPRPLRDLIALIRLIRLFRTLRPDVVNAGTPKAGMLGMLAAWFCRVRVRIYTIRGFRHESLRGWARRLMILNERFICRLAHEVICIAGSVRELAIAERIAPPEKLAVLAKGSSNGIDLQRFNPEVVPGDDVEVLRSELKLEAGNPVVGFVGRLIPRKGVEELVEAWQRIRRGCPDGRLLLVGPADVTQPLPSAITEAIREDPSIIETGRVKDVERYFPLMDIFVLPAHWEGFGNVLMEAAAMGCPVISTDGTGSRDAVRDGFNGTLVPVRDAVALEGAIRKYLADADLRAVHGKNGRQWAQGFANEIIWEELERLYRNRLGLPEASAPSIRGGQDARP